MLSCTTPTEILLGEPEAFADLFSNQGEYRRFREEYTEAVAPEMGKWLQARRRSEAEARLRPVC